MNIHVLNRNVNNIFTGMNVINNIFVKGIELICLLLLTNIIPINFL